jgi:hypothetical protein
MNETPPVLSDLRGAFSALPSARRFEPEQIDVLYGLAHSALAAGRNTDAQNIFDLLTLYAGSQPRVWAGRAAAGAAQGRWQDALIFWSMAAMLEPERVDYTLGAGYAELMLGKPSQARDTLTLALRAAERQGDAPAAERAAGLLSLLPHP